jgi:hypothetical protein
MDMSTADFMEIVLRINPETIIDKSRTLEYWLHDSPNLHKAVEYINQFHSYFHFEQSNLNLEAAKICAHLCYQEHERQYLEKAIFQDHINHEAIKKVAQLNGDFTHHTNNIPYSSYIKFESDYIKRFIGNFNPSEAILNLDHAIRSFDQGDVERAVNLIIKINEQWHRLLLLKAKISVHNKLYELALEQINEALRLIEHSHKSYHRTAAMVYKLRADEHYGNGKFDLAKNDLIKSKDLDPEL